jgi:hypothetical protein
MRTFAALVQDDRRRTFLLPAGALPTHYIAGPVALSVPLCRPERVCESKDPGSLSAETSQ